MPHLKPKKQHDLTSEDIVFHDIRKKGILGNLDKRRTIMESLKRNARQGRTDVQITEEDLRFKTWQEQMNPSSTAVVLAMMDTSGSMGTFEKYMARSFYFWMVRYLRRKYSQVKVVFIAHTTEAKEVTEDQFFTKVESGGTRCSAAE